MRTLALLLLAALTVSGCGDPKTPTEVDDAGVPDDAAVVDRPLEAALREKREAFSANASDEVKAMFEKGAAEIAASGVLERAKKVGSVAPDFELEDHRGRPHELSDLMSDGPVVLTFYRGKWCPYCNAALAALQRVLPEIQERGATLVAISPMTAESSTDMQAAESLTFPVLSDLGNSVARSYGLVFTVPESLRPVYAQAGIDLPATNGDESFELPVPATYVIDGSGTIRWAHVDLDYTRRAEPADVLKALDDL